MNSWYFPALLALLLLGIQRFFYKVAAENKYPTEWVTFSFMATVTLLSAGAYFSRDQNEPAIGFLLAAGRTMGCFHLRIAILKGQLNSRLRFHP